MTCDSTLRLPAPGASASARAQGRRIPALAGSGDSGFDPAQTPRAISAAGNAGFTLVELLVVVAVILILAALLFPAAQTSINSSRQVQCVSNLRQLTQAVLQYASDHGNRLPSDTTWMTCVAPYVGEPASAANLDTLGVFRCPAGWNAGARTASNQLTYWYNRYPAPFGSTANNADFYTFPSLSLFNHPDQTIILTCWWFYLWSGNWTTPPSDTHPNGRPVSYLDGHVVFNTIPAYYQYGGPPMSALVVY